jgi:hypothetical protein
VALGPRDLRAVDHRDAKTDINRRIESQRRTVTELDEIAVYDATDAFGRPGRRRGAR